MYFKKILGNSSVVQWLGFGASTAGGTSSIPGQGTKVPQATRYSQKKKKKNLKYLRAPKNVIWEY